MSDHRVQFRPGSGTGDPSAAEAQTIRRNDTRSDVPQPEKGGEKGTEMAGKVTAPQVRARKGGQKLTMVTAYDAPTARIADRAGAVRR